MSIYWPYGEAQKSWDMQDAQATLSNAGLIWHMAQDTFWILYNMKRPLGLLLLYQATSPFYVVIALERVYIQRPGNHIYNLLESYVVWKKEKYIIRIQSNRVGFVMEW